MLDGLVECEQVFAYDPVERAELWTPSLIVDGPCGVAASAGAPFPCRLRHVPDSAKCGPTLELVKFQGFAALGK